MKKIPAKFSTETLDSFFTDAIMFMKAVLAKANLPKRTEMPAVNCSQRKDCLAVHCFGERIPSILYEILQGRVKFPIGGKVRERANAGFGAIPKPTVTVWMEEE